MALQPHVTMQKDCYCSLEIRKFVIDGMWDASVQHYSSRFVLMRFWLGSKLQTVIHATVETEF
jgi:hypothetical protein